MRYSATKANLNKSGACSVFGAGEIYPVDLGWFCQRYGQGIAGGDETMIEIAVVDVARPIGSGKVFNGAGFATGKPSIAG